MNPEDLLLNIFIKNGTSKDYKINSTVSLGVVLLFIFKVDNIFVGNRNLNLYL